MVFKNQKGFTLIEVLIAIIILAFISLYAYKMIDENTDTKERVIAEDRDLMQTLTAMNRIEVDFNEFYSPLFSYSKQTVQNNNDPYKDTSTNSNSLFEGKTKDGTPIPQVMSENKSTLIFLSLVNRRKVAESKESNFTWIKYSIKPTQDEENRKNGGNDLVRQSISADPFAQNLNWDNAREQIILSNLKSFEFNFYDEKNKKYTNTLADLNENKNSIRLLKVNFTWVNRDGNEFKFEKIFRVLTPYFNTKQDDLKTQSAGGGGTWGGSNPPGGLPDPNNATDNPGDNGGIVQ